MLAPLLFIFYYFLMSRLNRDFKTRHSYHITVRCNNRDFRLTSLDCRKVLLYTIQKAIEKYDFKLYALCIMSNHIHYLMEPQQPDDLPKIMHLLNWYSAMCFNRMLNRTGHFWEKRYHATGFPHTDKKRALNTLRYIHANPKAAGMQQGMFYDFSNYGVYDRLGDDGLTTWHPAFLALGETLEECAAKYRGFCKKYRSQPKKERRNHWGKNVLKGLKKSGKGKKKTPPGQLGLPWDTREFVNPEVEAVAEKFIFANCYNPKVAGNILRREGCSTSRVKSAEQLELRAVTGNEKLEPARVSRKMTLLQIVIEFCKRYMLHSTSLDARKENQTNSNTPPNHHTFHPTKPPGGVLAPNQTTGRCPWGALEVKVPFV